MTANVFSNMNVPHCNTVIERINESSLYIYRSLWMSVCLCLCIQSSVYLTHVHVGLCIVLFMRRSVALTLCTFQLTLIQQRVRRSPGLISYISYITSPVTCVAFVTEKNTLWRRLAEGDLPPPKVLWYPNVAPYIYPEFRPNPFTFAVVITEQSSRASQKSQQHGLFKPTIICIPIKDDTVAENRAKN